MSETKMAFFCRIKRIKSSKFWINISFKKTKMYKSKKVVAHINTKLCYMNDRPFWGSFIGSLFSFLLILLSDKIFCQTKLLLDLINKKNKFFTSKFFWTLKKVFIKINNVQHFKIAILQQMDVKKDIAVQKILVHYIIKKSAYFCLNVTVIVNFTFHHLWILFEHKNYYTIENYPSKNTVI